MSARKVVQRELSRSMIMDTARFLFAQSGYQHVSMRKIAQELNYSHGALYYHFKNKAELFYAIITEDFLLLNQLLDEIMLEELTNNEKLKKILLKFIQFGLDHPNHYELMFLTRDSEVQAHLQQAPNLSYEKFGNAMYILCGPQINVQQVWSVFICVHGFVTTYIRNNQAYDEVKILAESHVEFILKGIE